MIEYFALHLNMIGRRLKEMGIHPVIGLVLIILVFFFGSYLLFEKSQFASAIYAAITLFYVSKTNVKDRNAFLKSIFRYRLYYKIRVSENLLIAFPFVGFLMYNNEFIIAALLVLISILLALNEFELKDHIVIPTPFFKKPFEFLVGFRSWYYIIVIAFFLVIMAIIHQNLNLGIFSMLLIYVLCIGFYMKPEDPYYVWNYKHKPNSFLFVKIKTAILQSFVLIFPVLMALSVFYFSDIKILMLFFISGNVFLIAGILAKYASYPYEMQLPYMILLVISVFFPPLLLFLIPFLFWKATQHLYEYLV